MEYNKKDGVMKNYKNILYIVLIIIIAFLIRLINLDKSGGLWYDEATIYSIASKKSISGMYNADSHRFLLFPIYYILYHYWIKLFGNSDIVIRFMSVCFDILAIITAYFTGKTFGNIINKNKNNIGIIYAILYTLNSSFIYYAQEAKFYSCTFFLINLLLLSWLKFIQKQTIKRIWIYTIISTLLICTYTSQILLVIILHIITFIYLKQTKADNLKLLIVPSFAYIPVIVFCGIQPHYFSGNFTAVTYDNSFIILALQNWFTPILEGLQNNIPNYHRFILNNILNIKLWLFIIFPITFIISGIINAIKNNKISLYLFATALIYVCSHIIFTYISNYNVLVRYTLPALPILLFVAAYGISNMQKKFILAIFIIINLIYINVGAPFIPRPEGYRGLANAIKQAQISQNYNFILPIRKDLLDKYFPIKGEKMSLYDLNTPDAMKTYLTEEEIQNINLKTNKNIKRFISESNIPQDFENYVIRNYIKNKPLVLITDKSICMFSNQQLEIIAKSSNINQYPFQFLRMSKLNNDLIKVLAKNMRLKQKIVYNSWEIYIFDIQ